jgi:hypothetical protein
MLFLTTKMYITFQEGDLLDHRDIYKSKVSGVMLFSCACLLWMMLHVSLFLFRNAGSVGINKDQAKKTLLGLFMSLHCI